MTDKPQQSFSEARQDAMNEINSDPLLFRAEAPGIDAKVSSGSSLILTIDKGIGKQFLLILWISAFVSAAAVIAIMFMIMAMGDVKQAAATELRATTAHVNTLQYDLAQVKAQLIERGLYEPTSH